MNELAKTRRRNNIRYDVAIVTMGLAFCSIVYELLLSNTLSIVMGDYVWWQSLTIGFFIGGLGIGSYWSSLIKDPKKGLMHIELSLSFLGGMSVVYVLFFHIIYRYLDHLFFFTSGFHPGIYLQNLFIVKVIFFILVQTLTFAIGALSGFEVPLMIRFSSSINDENKVQDSENSKDDYLILGLNYFGTLVGTLVFSYLLLPKLDTIKTSLAVAGVNLAICLYFYIYISTKRNWFYISLMALILSLICFVGFNEKNLSQLYLKAYYYMPRIMLNNDLTVDEVKARIDHLPNIERQKSTYQYLDIYSFPAPGGEGADDAKILALDTKFQFNTETEYFYHEAFAHVPIAINKMIPRKVLILGGGDGLLLRELLKYKEIESIDFIELDPAIISLSKTRFAELNKNSLSDSRVHVQVNDAFHYLRNTHNKYDAVFIDFPYPNSYDLARLYSVEFYFYVNRALKTDGFVALDVPFFDQEDQHRHGILGRVTLTTIFNETHLKSNSVFASTFYYAGFKTIFPYKIPDESFVFLKKQAGEINYDFVDHLDKSKISEDLRDEFLKIKNQNFPFNISKEWINSVFLPKLMNEHKYN